MQKVRLSLALGRFASVAALKVHEPSDFFPDREDVTELAELHPDTNSDCLNSLSLHDCNLVASKDAAGLRNFKDIIRTHNQIAITLLRSNVR